MNDTLKLMLQRATCRSYEDKAIAEDTLKQLLEAGCSAPSSGGFENRAVIVVRDEEKRAALCRLSRGQGFVKRAPVSLVFCVDLCRERRITELIHAPFRPEVSAAKLSMCITDAAICAENCCIAAEALGLASCYNGNVIEHAKELSELLELPRYVLPVIMLTVGYPRSLPKPSRKYPLSVQAFEDVYSMPTDEALLAAYRDKTAGERYDLTPERLSALCATAKAYGGDALADACRAEAEKTGALNPYQYWLGCYYPSGESAMNMAEYAELLKKQGFEA